MSEITIVHVERAVKTTAATVLRNEQHFSNLDALAGELLATSRRLLTFPSTT